MHEAYKEQLMQMIKMNVPILDYQHSFLLDLFDKIYTTVPKESNFYKLFLEGNNYLKTHAAAEEEYMMMINYPHYEIHKKEHAKIISIYTSILENGIKNGGIILWNNENKSILSEWRHKHFDMDNESLSGDAALIKYVRLMKKLKPGL